jgi:hypothetical protein
MPPDGDGRSGHRRLPQRQRRGWLAAPEVLAIAIGVLVRTEW